MSHSHNSLNLERFVNCIVSPTILCVYCCVFMSHRRQRHHPGDCAAERPRLGPAQANADLLHGRAAVPARTRVPAVPIRRWPRAHRARQATQFVRNAGKEKTKNMGIVEINIINNIIKKCCIKTGWLS